MYVYVCLCCVLSFMYTYMGTYMYVYDMNVWLCNEVGKNYVVS